MSDTPTPETDATWHSFTGNTEFANNVKDLSRKLERERDEANYFLKELAEVDGQLKLRINELCGVLQKAEQERDEASDMVEKLTDQGLDLMDANRTLKRERDEAWAVAGELANVASKYLSFLLAVTPSKANETHEKETMKVIAALKRWKEL